VQSKVASEAPRKPGPIRRDRSPVLPASSSACSCAAPIMNTHTYEYKYAHPTSISTSERLSRLDLKIHEVGHQERLAVDGDVASH
jgi:hypothetical protein